MRPVVSVVVPTKNRASRFLPEAIESVLHQTYPHWELIVVDDRSTDQTAEVIRGYLQREPRVRYVLGPGRGPGASRNAGAAVARGTYLAFLDDDDLWLPEKLEQQVQAIDGDATVGLLYTKALVLDRRGQPCGEKPVGAPAVTFLDLVERNSIPTSSVLLRRDVFEMAGVFDEQLGRCQDYHLWLRVSRLAPVRYLDRPLIRYRWHAENRSHRPVVERLELTLAIFEDIIQLPLTRTERRLVAQRLAHLHYLLARVLIFHGHRSTARVHLYRSWSAEPLQDVLATVHGVALWCFTWINPRTTGWLRKRWQTHEPQLFRTTKAHA